MLKFKKMFFFLKEEKIIIKTIVILTELVDEIVDYNS